MANHTLFLIFSLLFLVGCSSENRKADWIRDALQSIRNGDYPRIKAINYWHETWKNSAWSTSNLRVDSSPSPEALEAYREGIADTFFVTKIALSEDSLKVLPPDYGVYHCAYPEFGDSEDTVTAQRISDFQNLVDKVMAWVTFADNWVGGIDFPADEVALIWDGGHLPYIKMMAFSRYEYTEGATDSIYTLQRIIDGEFDDDLKKWAQDAKASSIPMMACFGVEVNGEWFCWNGSWNGGDTTDGYGDPSQPDGPERFKDAYRHIVDLCRTEGADNITWMFHVNADSRPEADWNRMASYYPGDEYVDWIGISVYGPLTPKDGRKYWETFTWIMDTYYPELAALSADKPLAVVEYGVIE